MREGGVLKMSRSLVLLLNKRGVTRETYPPKAFSSKLKRVLFLIPNDRNY